MKAILVVDVEEYGDYYVDVYRKDADDRFEGRYYLKPMPEKKRAKIVGFNTTDYVEQKLFADGWNDCIKEIEK